MKRHAWLWLLSLPLASSAYAVDWAKLRAACLAKISLAAKALTTARDPSGVPSESPIQGLSAEAKRHYHLLLERAPAETSSRVKLKGLTGDLVIAPPEDPRLRAEVFVSNLSDPAYRRAIQAFATANHLPIFYRHVFSYVKSLREDPSESRHNLLYIELESPADVAKFLKFQVEHLSSKETPPPTP
ncbi:MAG TPA: hypothetical protein VM901_13335 [Bdellovibrionota bacterium]|jgi:hypothetical protein|nr:hypothetical protein [Bdellovibrionota bacterium]